MNIPPAALAAGAKAARFIEPNLYQTPHNPERYYTSVAQEILNAAMPHIRKQIAEEIRSATDHDGWVLTFEGGIEYAADIVEGNTQP